MSDIDLESQGTSVDKAAEDEKLVPVSEAIRYRKRAQVAEKKLDELEEQLQESSKNNKQLGSEIEEVRAEKKLLSRLTSAGVCDIEAAVLIAKERMKGQESPDVDTIVEQLRHDKVYLFRDPESVGASKTAGERQRKRTGGTVLERAARKAATSGNRVDLQEYLKVRRQFV